MKKLAVPKDRWKVGRELLALQRLFPHDRVLERMVRVEFCETQAFRLPEEYDVFDKEEDNRLRIFEVPPNERGIIKTDKGEYGSVKLESFKVTDQTELALLKRQQANHDRAKIGFERALVKEAQEYLQKAKARMSGEESRGAKSAKTMRESLAEAYQRMLKEHASYMKTNFRLLTYGMDEASSTFKKSFPDSYKRAFFRVIKALADRKSRRLPFAEVRRRVRKLPPSFITTCGPAGNCTFHNTTCPREPCPYATFNKKIIATVKAPRVPRVGKLPTRRQRIFYREDLHQRLERVFMTRSELINCTFEPATGSLIDQSLAGIEVRRMFEAEVTPNSFTEKLGSNLGKLHPDVLKKGKLKQAQQFFKQGEFAKAKSTLSDAFNIHSLRSRFDPKYQKQQLVKNMMTKMKADRVNKEEAAKIGLGTDNKMRGAVVDKLAHMREKVEDTQKKVPNEDFENTKLFPILDEAYQLIAKIEAHEAEAQRKIARVAKARQELKERQKQQVDLKSVDDQLANTAVIFKTIMCPLGEACPNLRRKRWPDSSLKTVTRFG